MPEHVHMLLSEPQKADVSVVMQVLKQRFARRVLHSKAKTNSRQIELWSASLADERFWQRRFYDFNVFSARKMTEKLRYMHRNRVKSGLGSGPDVWRWRSYRSYALGKRGPVNMDWMLSPYKIRATRVRRFGQPEEDS